MILICLMYSLCKYLSYWCVWLRSCKSWKFCYCLVSLLHNHNCGIIISIIYWEFAMFQVHPMQNIYILSAFIFTISLNKGCQICPWPVFILYSPQVLKYNSYIFEDLTYIYTHTLIASGNLLCSAGSPAQCSVVTWLGVRWSDIEEERIYVQTADSLPCTAEFNATL